MLRLRQLRPYGPAATYHSVGQNSEERARRGTLDLVFEQARSLLAAFGPIPMAFRAVLRVELAACRNRIGVIFEGVALWCAPFPARWRSVNQSIVSSPAHRASERQGLGFCPGLHKGCAHAGRVPIAMLAQNSLKITCLSFRAAL